ncbi:adenylyl-sulfate kinase [Alphaproteobacteria bacterium]|nr:adenylyl-sulfate kinase [Alphaproteobacteria bacterium]
MVIWFIGLSGAGKTTLANQVFAMLKKKTKNVVLIDGDVIREIFSNDLGHTIDDRRKNAERISALCKFLDEQDINVVCSILSLFPDNREWNRRHISRYYEVFIDTPMEQLVQRDVKGLYKQYLDGDLKNLPGLDIDFPIPEAPDLRILNDSDLDALLLHADQLVALFGQ